MTCYVSSEISNPAYSLTDRLSIVYLIVISNSVLIDRHTQTVT